MLKSLVLQCFLEGRPLNLGGEVSPQKFRGYGLTGPFDSDPNDSDPNTPSYIWWLSRLAGILPVCPSVCSSSSGPLRGPPTKFEKAQDSIRNFPEKWGPPTWEPPHYVLLN